MSEVWLIRHGETEWSRSGAHTGRTDIPLTGNGIARAKVIGEYLARRPFALVLTSPLQRARETCRLAGYGPTAVEEADLREWDYGPYEGKKTDEMRETDPEWSIWTAPVQGGESVEDVGVRARRVIEKVSSAGGDVALFGHGHMLRILAACWIGLPPDGGRLLALDTAGISILGYERKTRVIKLWNRALP